MPACLRACLCIHAHSLCIWQLEDEASAGFETRHTGTAIHQLGMMRTSDLLKLAQVPRSLHNTESIRHLLGIKRTEATVPITLYTLPQTPTVGGLSDDDSSRYWALVTLPRERVFEHVHRPSKTVKEVTPGPMNSPV